MARSPKIIDVKATKTEAVAEAASSVPVASTYALAFKFDPAQVDAVLAKGRETLDKLFGDYRTQFEAAVQRLADLNEASPRSFAAIVASSQAATKGFEALNTEAFAFSKTQLETAVDVSKKLAAARSFEEVADLQAGFARATVDAYLAEAKKFGALAKQIAEDSAAPVQAEFKSYLAHFTKKAA